MKVVVGTKVKHLLSKLIPESSMLRFLTYLPKLETWRKRHAKNCPTFKDRYELYTYINTEILRNGRIDYLEFGVYKGTSIKYWSQINTHDYSRFWGFDTFTGLPQVWDRILDMKDKGNFDTKGQTPNIKDTRVSFVKGLFQETLPDFLEKENISSQLVIHNDADLYSSTLYVLTRCDEIIVDGTIVIFDEFSTVLDEYRALEDYCQSYMREYEVLGCTKSMRSYYSQVAIRAK